MPASDKKKDLYSIRSARVGTDNIADNVCAGRRLSLIHKSYISILNIHLVVDYFP